jgi:RNA-dependent RNA polymerase
LALLLAIYIKPAIFALAYYRSDKALGQLYRAIQIEKPSSFADIRLPPGLEVGPAYISKRLRPLVEKHFPPSTGNKNDQRVITTKLVNWFKDYVAELTHIAHAHSLSTDALVRLDEQELVLGTIMAPSTQPRHRREKVARLKLHMRNLVKMTALNFGQLKANTTRMELQSSLKMAWESWEFSVNQADTFGGPSFGLIALGYTLRVLKLLSAKAELSDGMQQEMFYNGIVELGVGESWD